ncbi:Uncharacterized protein APZ42_010333 [Daphnia magna]|uniref:Uncharacterized protein n=1 Tax=Daphnia magna TaxID=35525 RepID=A0A164DFS2_9CRUS|nr:Uncharacterized protein APZ42_010333 [Daphnia magna]
MAISIYEFNLYYQLMTATLHSNSWQHWNLSRTFIQFTSKYISVQYTCFSEFSKSKVTIKFTLVG